MYVASVDVAPVFRHWSAIRTGDYEGWALGKVDGHDLLGVCDRYWSLVLMG